MENKVYISELMDNYTDSEFLIDGEQGADTDAVLRGVMKKVKPKKQRLRLGVKLLVAAAVVTASVSFLVAAGVPETVYNLLNGEVVILKENEMTVYMKKLMEDSIYRIEDERIIFIADGQKLDITDMIDENTPYIYHTEVKDSHGKVHDDWIAVAGTIEHIGSAETLLGDEPYIYAKNGLYYQFYVDGEIIEMTSEGEIITYTKEFGTSTGRIAESPDIFGEYIDLYPHRSFEMDWFKSFREQAGFDEDFRIDSPDWTYPFDYDKEIVECDFNFE